MTVSARHFWSVITLLAFCLGVACLENAVAQDPPPPPEPPQTGERAAERETLREEIRQYSALVQAMRESLAVREAGGEQDGDIEAVVLELSSAVGAITEQLADLELDVVDNQLNLRDGRGGQVSLDIPEDLPEQLSAGLSSITRMFLENMPDTVRIGDMETGFTFDFDEGGLQFQPVRPPRTRRVIDGGLLKIRDTLTVAEDEDVVGDVVAIMGDAIIEGRVLGNVVVVMGDVELGESADVEGQVVSVLGTLDRADGASVGSVTVVNPGSGGLGDDLAAFSRGWASFFAFQGIFLVLLVMVLLLVGLAPAERRERLLSEAGRRPGACLGLGLVALLVGHAAVLGLSAILVLTVIGIPVALLAVGFLLILDLAAVGVGALVVGRGLCSRLGLSCPRTWRELILGMLVLHTPAFLAAGLGVLNSPQILVMTMAWLGTMVKLIVFCYGMGALLVSRFGTLGARRQVATSLDSLHENPVS